MNKKWNYEALTRGQARKILYILTGVKLATTELLRIFFDFDGRFFIKK